MQHVVQFSFGIGSWAAAKLVAREHGIDNLVLLSADTKYEDEDTYAWGEAAARNVGGTLVRIADGRDVWQVFRDESMIGNTRADPCSRILKRELCDHWMRDHCDPADTTLYVGIHWSEAERFSRIDRATGRPAGIKHRMAAAGWVCKAPLCEPPLIAYSELHAWAEREGLWKQRLYQLGFPHANCGGRCVKQGQSGWAHLLRVLPERYRECEAQEEALRQHLGKDVSILRDRRGGKTLPMTLRAFRERIEAGGQCDLFDWGGCGCFAGTDDAAD